MFPSSSVNGVATPLANTMDLLQPWMLAALAALEIEGISAIAGNYTTDNLERVGRKNLGKGAKVTVTSGEVRVDLSLVMGYGYNIPTTCSKVQSRVRTSVENMTGLKVTDVNIHVAGISMNQGE